MLGMVGYGVSSLLFGLATELWMLYAARALSGVLSAAAASTAMAYIGDSTSDVERGGGMGILGAAGGLGIILGPGFGGWLGGVSLAMPFFAAAGISLVSMLLILFLLPESLSPEARQPTGGRIKTMRSGELWIALLSPIGILLFMAFLSSFGLANFEAVFGLYALQKFHYGPGQVGVILAVVGLVSAAGKVSPAHSRSVGEMRRSSRLRCSPARLDSWYCCLQTPTPLSCWRPVFLSCPRPSCDRPCSRLPRSKPPWVRASPWLEQFLHEPGPHRRATLGRLCL